ncbi:hypothetical protein DSM14862_03302 (plasmid) [Sulfitobacter indolifex]|nr:hypothetical protein DSM14862_03302 [Sulfitobacter indolifex]
MLNFALLNGFLHLGGKENENFFIDDRRWFGLSSVSDYNKRNRDSERRSAGMDVYCGQNTC